jgi:hypothetical protein
MISLDNLYVLTIIPLCAWAVMSSMEGIVSAKLLSEEGLLSWRIMGLRRGGGILKRFVDLSPGPLLALVCHCLIFVTSLIALLTPIYGYGVASTALFLMLGAKLLICYRVYIGNDGSDQMATILIVGALLMSLGLSQQDNLLTFSGILLVGGQAILAYFASGAAKFISPTWRSGDALSGVMNTQTYGVIAHADVRRAGAAGEGNPFKVRRMASSAPMAFRRAVSMTDLMSA